MKKSKTRLYINKKISPNLMIYIKEKQHHFLKNVLRIKVQDENIEQVTKKIISELHKSISS